MLEDPQKKIFIGSDHAGYTKKKELVGFLSLEGYDVVDLGCFSGEEACDYPDIAREVAEKVSENNDSVGVLLCGSGIGMSIAANRLSRIRAALVRTIEDAEFARRHNDANVIALGARVTPLDEQKSILRKFLETGFDGDSQEGERHLRRVQKLSGV